MLDISKADLHSVFPVEMRGDTLVVIPRGDASGFGAKELQAELAAVLSWLAAPEIKNLIVDLGSANYFGSQIIGAINGFVLKTQETGGRAGVCDISDEMLEAVKIMKLDTLWTFYDTRTAALSALASETFGEKVSAALSKWTNRIALFMTCLTVLMVVVAWVFVFRSAPPVDFQKIYYTFEDVYDEVKQKRELGASRANWKIFASNSREKIQQRIDEMTNSSDPDGPLTQHLMKAGRDCLLPILKDPKELSPDLEGQFQKHMKEAKKLLAAKSQE